MVLLVLSFRKACAWRNTRLIEWLPSAASIRKRPRYSYRTERVEAVRILDHAKLVRFLFDCSIKRVAERKIAHHMHHRASYDTRHTYTRKKCIGDGIVVGIFAYELTVAHIVEQGRKLYDEQVAALLRMYSFCVFPYTRHMPPVVPGSLPRMCSTGKALRCRQHCHAPIHIRIVQITKSLCNYRTALTQSVLRRYHFWDILGAIAAHQPLLRMRLSPHTLLHVLRRFSPEAPALILTVGLALTAASVIYAESMLVDRDMMRFRTDAEEMTFRANAALMSHVSILRSLAGFLSATPAMPNQSQFHLFASRLELERNYPSVQGLGYTHVFSPGAYKNAQTFAAQQGVGNITYWPVSERPEYHAILYLEPLNERNNKAIGYDMHTEQTRREAMDQARDTGLPVMTGKVTLVQEIDEDKQAGFLVYLPVYRTNTDLETTEGRRAALRGFAYMPFRARDFFDTTLGADMHPHIDVAVYMGTSTSEETRVYASHGYAATRTIEDGFVMSRSLDTGIGQTWTLVYVAAPDYRSQGDRELLLFFSLIGCLTTFGLWYITRQEVRMHEALSRKKDEFLHMAGHELRTPITSLHMYADLLMSKCESLGQKEAEPLLTKMDHQIRTVAQLIDDMLDTARIENDSLRLAPSRFRITDVVDEAVDAANAQSKDRTIHVTKACTPEVVADRQRIGQVLNNLLSNALKYSANDADVQVRLRCTREQVLIEVEDFGLGIPSDKLSHVFDRYYRVSGDEDAPQGLGLGLYISSVIMHLHEGSLGVQSVEGKGSTFTMSLPRARQG